MMDALIRVLVGALCGAAVGLQRELKDRPAGLRTHTLVSTGAALFTVLSLVAFPEADTARVAANVAVGIGFIGAGTIIRQGNAVVGLTTAASLWAVAAAGVAAGAGELTLALVSTLLIVLILTTFKWVEGLLGKKLYLEIELFSERRLRDEFSLLGEVVSLRRTETEKGYLYEAELFVREDTSLAALEEKLAKLGRVKKVQWRK